MNNDLSPQIIEHKTYTDRNTGRALGQAQKCDEV